MWSFFLGLTDVELGSVICSSRWDVGRGLKRACTASLDSCVPAFRYEKNMPLVVSGPRKVRGMWYNRFGLNPQLGVMKSQAGPRYDEA